MGPNNPENLPLFDDLLRDYQGTANLQVRASFRKGHKAVLMVMPTGCGKTRTTVCLPREGARVLVVCGQDELVKQWVASIKHLRRRAAAIEQTMHNWADIGDEWIVGTLQTLTSLGGGDKPRFRRLVGHIDLIVWDEVDYLWSAGYRDMMKEFIAGGARVLGVTATPFRSKKKDSLFGFFEECAFSMELREAFDQGWLVKPIVRMHRVKSYTLDSKKLGSKTAADFNPLELESILTREAPLHDIASLIAQHHNRATGHAMVRCVGKRQAQALRDLLQDRHGIPTACVWGTQPAEEREAELKRFRSGEATVITNVRVLGRGVDIPFINEVYLAAPTKSKGSFLQAIGRATRTVDDCLKDCKTAAERLAAIAASSKPVWVLHDLTATSAYHQPVTAIDVLCRDTTLIDQIKENHDEDEEEITLDDLDAEEVAELERLKELERVEREAERERRRGLVLGVTFESTDRDLFDPALAKSPKVQTWRMPFGKFRGRPVRDPLIPLSYLKWMFAEGNLTPRWLSVIGKEIERREEVKAREPEPSTPW
jgi:superfamily II DNA or RNA helicase